ACGAYIQQLGIGALSKLFFKVFAIQVVVIFRSGTKVIEHGIFCFFGFTINLFLSFEKTLLGRFPRAFTAPDARNNTNFGRKKGGCSDFGYAALNYIKSSFRIM